VNALDHVNDLDQAVDEMWRVLVFGGKVLLNVDCKERAGVRLEKRIGHPYSLTPKKLKNAFESRKWEVVFTSETEQDSICHESITMHLIKS
jgi:ubiquinone/menaquinone biosynthesis C-methylase UbiE